MVNLLKTFGKGFLYVIALPFFLVALVLFAIIGIFLFLFQIIRSIIFFFTGQKFFPELEEDKKLRLMKERTFGNDEEEEEMVEEDDIDNDDSTSEIILPFTQNEPLIEDEVGPEENNFETVEEAAFNEVEAPVEEEKEDIILERLINEEPQQQETIEEDRFEDIKEETLETSEKEEPIDEEEDLEEYVPKSSSYVIDMDEEDDTSNGVDIDYDVR